MDFQEIEHGWVRASPTQAAIEAARARANETLAVSAPITGDSWWTGYLAELAVCEWFTRRGVEVRRNGGLDDLPDLEVAGLGGVDVKSRIIRSGGFRPHYEVTCLASDLAKRAPSAMFHCVYCKGAGSIVLLGGIRTARFFTEARFVPAGGALGSGSACQHDNFLLPAARLTPTMRMPVPNDERPRRAVAGNRPDSTEETWTAAAYSTETRP